MFGSPHKMQNLADGNAKPMEANGLGVVLDASACPLELT
jgi:hypothetical protein